MANLIIDCPECLEYAKKEYGPPMGKRIGRLLTSEDAAEEGFTVTHGGIEMKVKLDNCRLCYGAGHFEIYSPPCPKCKDQHERGAPLGMIARNPYSAEKFYDECPACHGKGYISEAVVAGILAQYGNRTESILKELKGAGDHYYFYTAGMYVGVEWCENHEGYCHT